MTKYTIQKIKYKNHEFLCIEFEDEDKKILTPFIASEYRFYPQKIKENIEDVLSENLEQVKLKSNEYLVQIEKDYTYISSRIKDADIGMPCKISTAELKKILEDYDAHL